MATLSTLTDSARTFGGLPSSEKENVKLALLVSILTTLDAMADVTLPTLLNTGRTFMGLSPEDKKTVELALLSSIADTGAGGTAINSGSGEPTADPGVDTAIYIDNASATVWYWYDSAWHTPD